MGNSELDDDIVRMIRDNYGKEVTECPQCSEKHKFIGTLYVDDESFEYYVWWRTCIKNGTYPDVDKSLPLFFFKELQVMGEPLSKIEKWSEILSKTYSGTRCGNMISQIHLNVCSAQLKFPGSNRFLPDSMDQLNAAMTLSGPSVILNDEKIKGLTGYLDDLPDEFDVFFSRIMENMSETLWNLYDTNIIEFLSHGRIEKEYAVSRYITPYEKEPKITVDVPDSGNAAFKQRMNNICLRCLRMFSPESDVKKISVLEPVVERAIEQAVADSLDGRKRPDVWHPERFVLLTKYDGHRTKGSYNSKYEISTWENNSVIYPDAATSGNGNKPTKTELEAFFSAVPNGSCEYVPCTHRRPYPSDLSEKERRFYLHWREMIKNGEYLPTDENYISLYLYETVSSKGDAKEIMKKLLGMAEHYECELTAETCMSYAAVKKLPLPNYGDLIPDPRKLWYHHIVHDALKSKPISPLSFKIITTFLGENRKEYADIDPKEFCILGNRILKRFDEYLEATERKRLIDLAPERIEILEHPAYTHLSDYGLKRTVKVKIPFPFNSNRLSEIVYASFMVALQTVCRNNHCNYPRAGDVDETYRKLAASFIEKESDAE